MPPHRLRLSVCIPVFRGSDVLRGALMSVLHQTFAPFEVLVGDDNRPEDTAERRATERLIRSLADARIRYEQNNRNLGSALNIKRLAERAAGDIIFFLCQDDLLSAHALERTYDAFLLADDIAFVTRPYFWFDGDIRRPVRAVEPYDPLRDAVLSLHESKRAFLKIFETVGQISGLGYRRASLPVPFGDETFTGHIYPIAGTLREHRCVFLKDYTVAVRVRTSQARFHPKIYTPSPTQSWMRMYDTVFAENAYAQLRAWGHEHIGTNYIGLLQVKNYGPPGALYQELRMLINAYSPNRTRPTFWLFAVLTVLLPRFLLRRAVDAYKTHFLAPRLREVVFRPAS